MICCWHPANNEGTLPRTYANRAIEKGRFALTMTLNPANLAAQEIATVLGDVHPLVEQLGSTEGLVALNTVSAALRLERIETPAALSTFLGHYRSQILAPIELPAIAQAYCHAAAGRTRELVALDRELASRPVVQELASASQRVGRGQLRRLRPLRDQRLVQRYLNAVEGGEACGWHTVVYGMTLALFSLPLRQGMSAYAQQTLRGFIHSAIPKLGLTENHGMTLLDEQCEGMPQVIAAVIARHQAAGAARIAPPDAY